jgi:UDP-N-acetylglucosamine 2-epimerase
MMKKILTVIGARPQFTKCAVVSKNLRNSFQEILIHTGQHYDYKMSESFFEELNIPDPDYNLNIGGMSHAKMTAQMMLKLETIIENENPDGILIYGDTDSTLAAGLVAAKLYIPLIHIEAGERIYNKKNVPEEINRVIVDHISNLNLCSTEDAVIKLAKEGLLNATFVGDPMYDLYFLNKPRIESNIAAFKEKISLPEEYALLTIHRVENTLDEDRLYNILSGLIANNKPILWPIHPRTNNLLQSSESLRKIASNPLLQIIEPLPYIDFSTAIALSSIVVSDSGGVIRESYFAEKYCIVPLQNSWWKNIVEAGWSSEVRDDKELILAALEKYWNYQSANKPAYFGNGNASEKITQELLKFLN